MMTKHIVVKISNDSNEYVETVGEYNYLLDAMNAARNNSRLCKHPLHLYNISRIINGNLDVMQTVEEWEYDSIHWSTD